MEKRIGQVLSLILVVAILVSMSVPVFAAEGDYSGAVTGWWDKILYQWTQNSAPYWWGDAVQSVSGLASKEVCGSSPDAVHHASSVSDSEMVKGPDGSFAYATCTYCHERFKVYASDLQQSYDAQVAELPAQGISSAGKLIWSPTLSDINFERCRYDVVGSNFSLSALPCSGNCSELEFVESLNAIKLIFTPTGSFSRRRSCSMDLSYIVPVNGTYVFRSTPICSTRTVDVNGAIVERSYSYPVERFGHYSSGASLDYWSSDFSYGVSADVSFSVIYWYLPVFEIIPDTSIDIGSTGDTYNINSRPTSITGDYGIIGDNGQIIKVEGDKIVNETNNTYYNPATGETITITDWSYNYEDRSYTVTTETGDTVTTETGDTVTTETGDTVTITYGDENVVIKEGDTIYNIYYLVNGSGSETPDPGPGPCNHQWTETSTTPAACTVPGSRTLTCSLCNETKTETIPAPGHKWTVKQEVKNEYDENGNQTQEGYTIWECSVCGEQQKTTDGTAPSGGGSGTGSGSSGGVFSGIFGLLVDFLGFFWNTFRDFVGEGVKGFLTALMDGTSSIFGLLNPFNWGG